MSALEKTMRHLDQEKRALEYEKGVLLEENEDLKGELEDVKESSRLDAVEAANQLRAARTQARENHQTAAAGPSGNELRTAIAEKTEAQEEADRAYAQLREAKKATDRAMAETRKAQEEARKAKEAAEASRSGVISTRVASGGTETWKLTFLDVAGTSVLLTKSFVKSWPSRRSRAVTSSPISRILKLCALSL